VAYIYHRPDGATLAVLEARDPDYEAYLTRAGIEWRVHRVAETAEAGLKGPDGSYMVHRIFVRGGKVEVTP
jgi:hypothetical protein